MRFGSLFPLCSPFVRLLFSRASLALQPCSRVVSAAAFFGLRSEFGGDVTVEPYHVGDVTETIEGSMAAALSRFGESHA